MGIPVFDQPTAQALGPDPVGSGNIYDRFGCVDDLPAQLIFEVLGTGTT